MGEFFFFEWRSLYLTFIVNCKCNPSTTHPTNLSIQKKKEIREKVHLFVAMTPLESKKLKIKNAKKKK